MAVHPSGQPVYVTDWFEHRIWVISPETGEVTAEVHVGNSPSGIAVTADGNTIVTADRDSDQLSFIDAETLQVKRTAKVGSRPFGVTVDDKAAAPSRRTSEATRSRWSTSQAGRFWPK